MRKKQTPEEVESKRKQILDAAMALLMKEDYHRITIRQLTAQCGIATGTFFNYFPSKETLFLYLLYGKNIEYFTSELKRFQSTAPDSYEAYVRFLLDGAKDMIHHRQDMITLFILHHAILSSVQPENVPEEANRQYITAMTELAAAIHERLPIISEAEALRQYSFLHAHLIGARHIAPISALGNFYPSWFDGDEEVLRAFERFLKGTREELEG